MAQIRAIRRYVVCLLFFLCSGSHAGTLEEFHEANDDLSSYLLMLDRSDGWEERIIESLAQYVSADLTRGNLDLVFALTYKAFFYYKGESIIGGWCADALRNAIGNGDGVKALIKLLEQQSSSLNSVEAIIAMKIIEELAGDQYTEIERGFGSMLRKHPDKTVSRLARELRSGRSPQDLRVAFEEKFEELSSEENAAGDVRIVGFQIAKDFSIYQETRYGLVREFQPSADYRTFFKTTEPALFPRPSDYGDLIEVTDKLTRMEALTNQEKAFLKRAKPVFLVSIKNEGTDQVALEAIVLVVRHFDRVLGGGTRTIRPDLMYEIEVPTEEGTVVVPITENKLLIETGETGQFYLGLNSTNKRVLANGAVLFPQIDYELEIYFHFGRSGDAKIRHLRVLL